MTIMESYHTSFKKLNIDQFGVTIEKLNSKPEQYSNFQEEEKYIRGRGALKYRAK